MTESSSGNSNNANSSELSVRTNSPNTGTISASSLRSTSLKMSEMEKLFNTLMGHMRHEQEKVVTGWAQLIQSHSSGRISFELSGNSN